MSGTSRRIRLGGRLAVVASLALALSACGGIPMSGVVQGGPALGEVTPDYVVNPSGPADGAEPRDILSGFMQAVRAPQSNYAVARQFLTADLAASWNPDAGVVIRSGTPVVNAIQEEGGVATWLTYAFTTGASVDSAGRYRESGASGERVLEFAFEQVDGQWRIAAAPDGIVLTASAFVRTFSAASLYYFDPSGRYLVPDLRWFPARSSSPARVVQELLDGPDDWLSLALVSGFPSGTELGTGGVVVESTTATIDLSSAAASSDPVVIGRMRQQLAATLGVANVTLSVNEVVLSGGPMASAAIDSQPSGAVLVGGADGFGYGTSAGIVRIPGISDVLQAESAVAVSLARDQGSAAYRAEDGVVRFVASGDETGTVIDRRQGLIDPGLDTYQFVWSATASGALEAFSKDGEAVGIRVDDLPQSARLRSLALSRDGTRLALVVTSPLGSQLLVYGIARQDGVPTRLEQPLELAVGGDLRGAQWVDDSTLVVLVGGEDTAHVWAVPIGAPSTDLGPVAGADAAVGGRGGVQGIRVLAGGVVLAADSDGGWNTTTLTAEFLGIQQ